MCISKHVCVRVFTRVSTIVCLCPHMCISTRVFTHARPRVYPRLFACVSTRVYIHPCVFTRVCVHTCIHDCVCLCVHTRVCISTHVCVHVYSCLCARVFTRVHMCTHPCVCTCLHVCVSTLVCAHAHTRACVSTLVCAHVHTCVYPRLCVYVSTHVCRCHEEPAALGTHGAVVNRKQLLSRDVGAVGAGPLCPGVGRPSPDGLVCRAWRPLLRGHWEGGSGCLAAPKQWENPQHLSTAAHRLPDKKHQEHGEETLSSSR